MRLLPSPPSPMLIHADNYVPQLDRRSCQPYERMAKRSELPSLNSATSVEDTSASSSLLSAVRSSDATTSASGSSITSSAMSTTMSSIVLSSSITLASNSTTAMPTVSTTSTTSSTSTSTSYTFQATVPTDEAANPYINRETLPLNSAFIITGAVFGALVFAVIFSWLFVWLKSRKKAKTEKEVQYYNPFQFDNASTNSATHLLGESAHSSLMEKSSSSFNSKSSNPASLGMDTTTPGRSYREMLNTMGRRSSMTISPVLDMMRSSATNLDLPLFNPAPDIPLRIPHTPTESTRQASRKPRPPSQMLDDMLTAIEFSAEYPEPQSSDTKKA